MKRTKSGDSSPKTVLMPIVISKIFDCDDVDPNEKLVYLTLLKHVNRSTGLCFPGKSTLANETGYVKATIDTHIDSLIKKGYVILHAKGGGRKSNTYLLPEVVEWIEESKKSKEKEPMPGTANADIDSNQLNNNINVTTNITDNVSESQPNATDLQPNSVANTTELTLDTLKELMNYTWLRDTATKDSELSMIDSVFELIYEVYTQTQSEYKINDYPIKGEVVKSKLIKLTHYNIKTAISTFLTNAETTEIRNHRSYLLTILYNTSLTSKITGAVALNDAGL